MNNYIRNGTALMLVGLTALLAAAALNTCSGKAATSSQLPDNRVAPPLQSGGQAPTRRSAQAVIPNDIIGVWGKG